MPINGPATSSAKFTTVPKPAFTALSDSFVKTGNILSTVFSITGIAASIPTSMYLPALPNISLVFSTFTGSLKDSLILSNFSLIDCGLFISTPIELPIISKPFTAAPSTKSPVFSRTGPTTGISAISGNSILFCSSILFIMSLAAISSGFFIILLLAISSGFFIILLLVISLAPPHILFFL